MKDLLRALEDAVASGRPPKAEAVALLGATEQLDHSATLGLLDRLDDLIRAHPPERTGLLAVLSGAIVEAGAAPQALPSSIFDRLVQLLDEMRPPSERDEGEEELPESYYQFEQAAIAALARSATLRQGLPQRSAIRQRLRSYATRYGFLGKMIEVLDDESVLVLHPSTHRGWECQIGGIGDNFQLHLLLLGALAGQGPNKIQGVEPSARAVSASSDSLMNDNETVGSNWQLANWFALREGGIIESRGDQTDRCWIWNEGFPAEIARFEGRRVILVGPSSYPRSWSSARVFPGMVGSLQVERQLENAEAASVMKRMLERLAGDPSAEN